MEINCCTCVIHYSEHQIGVNLCQLYYCLRESTAHFARESVLNLHYCMHYWIKQLKPVLRAC